MYTVVFLSQMDRYGVQSIAVSPRTQAKNIAMLQEFANQPIPQGDTDLQVADR